ncbi:sulfatase [Clostridium neonatale]|uniref:sulfatase n=1 Tax=Clostridium neonatale TaxID=137838 RepID=UPI001D637A0E|nr:sulfatase [Clostridium neonatale]CAG9718343.1 Arylsulfatase A [Clostridium neonatale]
MRTVVVLMDTLKRNMIEVYNPETWVKTPNLTKFSKEAVTFDNHWVGSAPCMPARRDILTGRLNFLERSWGPIEPFDITLPKVLAQKNVFSHIVTDHPHYFRLGGEDYVQQFSTWDFYRGQEGDPWISRIDDPTFMPDDYYGKLRKQYQWNRTNWPTEDEYPTPKTFEAASKWIEDNKGHDDFFLLVETFDPHEPFDVPDEYMDMYDNKYEGPYFETPTYSEVDVPEDALEYINKRYAALLTMTDNHFGKFIQRLKDLDMYEDTMIIVTTDHGYFLGERNYFGKNYMHMYNELAHIPLLVRFPKGERAGERVSSITQNIDIMPTVLDYSEIEIPAEVQGKSWKPIADNRNYQREYALYGYHGLAVNITDGEHTYFRSHNEENKPCYEYTCIPTTIRKYLGKGIEEQIEMGRFLKRTNYPLYKIPVERPSIIDNVEDGIKYTKDNMLFNIKKDYLQTDLITDEKIENKYIELIKKGLKEMDAPEEQYERLNLK